MAKLLLLLAALVLDVDASVCYESSIPLKSIEGCTCHASCGSCGYYANPVTKNDCIYCADGSTVIAQFADGTGCCGSGCGNAPPPGSIGSLFGDLFAPAPPPADEPCFSDDTTACRLASSSVSAMDAYNQCFLGAPAITAERVPMTALVAGDMVLADMKTSTSVVVNQHLGAGKTSAVLTIHHTEGSLTLTPDHVLELDGTFVASREAAAGATLSSGATVKTVSSGVSGIINPHTASGTILAADGVGKPVVAATGNEWLSSWLLSGYPKYTFTYTLAAAFPATVQQYYNEIIEHMSLGALAKFAHALPTPVVGGCLIVGDVAFMAGFVAFSLFSLPGAAALAALAAGYTLKKKA